MADGPDEHDEFLEIDEIDDARREAAALLHDEAAALWQRGRLDDAERVAREAVAALDAVLPMGHPDSANARDTLASIVAERGHPDEALALLRAAIAGIERYRGDEVADLIRLGIERNLGYALTQSGAYAEARAVIERVVDETGRLCGEQSPAFAQSLNLLGVLSKFEGRYDAAEAAYRRAHDILDAHGGAPASLLHNLSGLASSRGDFAAAEIHARAAVEARRLEGDSEDGGAPEVDELALGTDMAGLGDALAGLGRLVEAEAAYREALACFTRAGRDDHLEVAYALHNLADALAERGVTGEAERAYRDSIARKEAAFGAGHHEVAAGLANLAALLADVGRAAEAVATSSRAVTIARACLAPDHPVRVGCEALARRLGG